MRETKTSINLILLSIVLCLTIGFSSNDLLGQKESYQHSVEKILYHDTDINKSDVSSIRYSIFNRDSVLNNVIYLKNAPSVDRDSLIRFSNTLSLFPVYAYLSLRKYCDRSLSEEKILETGKISEWSDLTCEDLVFQISKIPKQPKRPDHFQYDYNIYDLTFDSLKELFLYQEPQEICSVSELNTLLAIYYIDSFFNEFPEIRKHRYLDQLTFAKAKKGKISYKMLEQISFHLLGRMNNINVESYSTNVRQYDIKNGFYYSEVKNNYPMYVMTGRNEVGRCFIGLIPSTKTGVVLLSQGEDKEIIDFGYLILRMLNHNWKR